MAKDFRAGQVRTGVLIASGCAVSGKTGLGLMIYSSSIAADYEGTRSSPHNTKMLSDVGTDVWLFVSGTANSEVYSPPGSNAGHGVTLFGGDVVVSGTFYADKMVVELDQSATGSLLVSGSLFVSQSVSIGAGSGLAQGPDESPDGVLDVKGNVNQGVPTLFVTHNDADKIAVDINAANTGAAVMHLLNTDVNNQPVVLLETNAAETGPLLELRNSNSATDKPVILSLNRSDATAEADGMDLGTIQFKGVDAGNADSTYVELFAESSEVTAAKEGGKLTIKLLSDTSSNAGASAAKEYITLGGQTTSAGASIVFNEDGIDCDFRVESDGETHMIFVEGATNRMSIGDSTDAPGATLEITNASDGEVPLLQLNSNDTDEIAVDINAANIDANVLDITANALTTGKAVNITTIAPTPIVLDLNHSLTTTATIIGLDIDIDKTGASQTSNAVTGIRVDIDDTAYNPNGAGDIYAMIGGLFTPTLQPDADNGTNTVTGISVISTGHTNGATTAIGASLTAVGGDTNTQLKLIYDASNYADFSVDSNGVLTIATIDASSDSGAITLDTVDKITLNSDTAGEGIVYADGGTDQLQIYNDGSNNVKIKISQASKTLEILENGGASLVHFGEAVGTVFNDGHEAAYDFRVESDNKPGAILVDSGLDQVSLLVDGTDGSDSYADTISATGRALPLDVGLFVSGVILGKGETSGDRAKGVSVFSGDLVSSGTLYVGGNENAPLALFGARQWDMSAGNDISTVFSGAQRGKKTNHSTDRGITSFQGDVVTSGSVFFGLQDDCEPLTGSNVTFYVSGGLGGHTLPNYDAGRGVAVFGGDTVISGNLYGIRNIGLVDRDLATNDGIVLNMFHGAGSFGGTGDSAFHINQADKFLGIYDQPGLELIKFGYSDASNPQAVIINDTGDADVDFRVETDTKSSGILLDGGADQVVILGDGKTASDSYKDTISSTGRALPGDIGIWISGSKGGIGDTSGHGSKGVAVFAGDVVVSGSYGSGAVFNDAAAADADFRVESSNNPGAILVDAGTDQVAILSKGTSAADAYADKVHSTLRAIPSDVGLFVSGTILSKRYPTSADANKLTVLGGDTYVSGAVFVAGENFGGDVAVEAIVIGDAWGSGLTSIEWHAAPPAWNDDNFAFYANMSSTSWYFNNRVTDGTTKFDAKLQGSGRSGAQQATMLLLDTDQSNPENCQVFIMSGCMHGPASPDESNFGDISFFVSGTTGTRGTSSKGVALFGGDLVASGAFYVDTISEETLAAGVTIDGVLMKDNDIVIPDGSTIGTATTNAAMTIDSSGIVTFADDIKIKDGGTIGNASVADVMTLASTGIVTFKDDILLPNDGTIGNATVSDLVKLENTGLEIKGHVVPDGDNTRDLGAADARWANIYTGDLHLRNDRGDWTVIEEEEYLSIRNNKTGKRYKFVLEEIDED